MADCKIREVWTGICRQPYQEFSLPRHGGDQGPRGGADGRGRRGRDAKAIPIPTDQQILHVLTRFVIDGQEDVREPLA